MVQKIKLMADYGCYSLWWEDAEKVGNIDPAKLPLSPEIVNRLEAWERAYDETLNWSNPANSPGFSSIKAKEYFELEGINLWKQLQKELAPDYEVLYFSKRLHKLIADSGDLEVLQLNLMEPTAS